jgi:hypothetical protein
VVIDFLENVTPYRKILFSKIMQNIFLNSGALRPKKSSTYNTNHDSADIAIKQLLVLKNSTK